jgi:hypothetical protein
MVVVIESEQIKSIDAYCFNSLRPMRFVMLRSELNMLLWHLHSLLT